MVRILRGIGMCFLCVFPLFVGSTYAADYFTVKPDYIPSCKIFQPHFTKCSTASVQRLMDEVGKGIPEITATLGTMDPMKLDKILFKQDNNEAASIRANITDLLVTGFSKMKIKESKVNKKDFSWETKINLPKMRLEGKYNMAGRILLLPLSGAGDFFIEIESLNILMHTKTRLYEKGNFTFYNVTSVKVDLRMKGIKTYFDNLFNGKSKDVERSTNEFFNENWREFFEALRPIVSETVERVLLNLLRETFNLFPANFLIEDIPTSSQLYGTKDPA